MFKEVEEQDLYVFYTFLLIQWPMYNLEEEQDEVLGTKVQK